MTAQEIADSISDGPGDSAWWTATELDLIRAALEDAEK